MTSLERKISTLALAAAAVCVPAAGFELTAQDTDASVLSRAEVRSLVSERSNTTVERRAALSAFLGKSEVRRIVASTGIDIRDVESATATLSDEEIGRLEPPLRAAEEALAGGATITIATTTIVIVALIVIILLIA